MSKVIPFLLYLWLIGMHRVFLADVTSIYQVSINLTAFIVLGVALYKSEIVASWFGFSAGIVGYAGLPQPDLLGWHALALAAIGLVAFHVRERLNLDSPHSRLLVVFGGVITHNIMVAILCNPDSFVFLLLSRALPGAVYTTIIAWIFFLFKDRKITAQRLKSIF